VGNEATPVERTVNVVDIAAPVITLNGEAVIEHNYGDAYVDAGATADDAFDGAVDATTTDSIIIDKIGSYGITYTATDAAGNVATLERIVNVADLKGPVITLNGNSTIILGQGRDYKELGATGLDAYDKEAIDIPTPTEGTVDNTIIGKYELTYTATDSKGQTSKLVRTVEVVEPRPFITTWKTTTDGESIAMRIDDNTYTYNFDVDWGDGTPVENYQAGFAVSHIYTKAGTYTVTINGALPWVGMNVKGFDDSKLKLININQWGDIEWEYMAWSFYKCSNVNSDATDTPDLRLVTDMSNMFQGATRFNAEVSDWDVSSVTNLSYTFNEASAFNQDLSLWSISSVTDMTDMLRDSSMSADNNDALLKAWSTQEVESNVEIGLGLNGYSGEAQAAFDILDNIYNWRILVD